MKKKASVSYDEWMIEELRADPKLAAEYLGQTMTEVIQRRPRTMQPQLANLARCV